MDTELPIHPNISQLKRQAKELKQQVRAGDSRRRPPGGDRDRRCVAVHAPRRPARHRPRARFRRLARAAGGGRRAHGRPAGAPPVVRRQPQQPHLGRPGRRRGRRPTRPRSTASGCCTAPTPPPTTGCRSGTPMHQARGEHLIARIALRVGRPATRRSTMPGVASSWSRPTPTWPRTGIWRSPWRRWPGPGRHRRSRRRPRRRGPGPRPRPRRSPTTRSGRWSRPSWPGASGSASATRRRRPEHPGRPELRTEARVKRELPPHIRFRGGDPPFAGRHSITSYACSCSASIRGCRAAATAASRAGPGGAPRPVAIGVHHHAGRRRRRPQRLAELQRELRALLAELQPRRGRRRAGVLPGQRPHRHVGRPGQRAGPGRGRRRRLPGRRVHAQRGQAGGRRLGRRRQGQVERMVQTLLGLDRPAAAGRRRRRRRPGPLPPGPRPQLRALARAELGAVR